MTNPAAPRIHLVIVGLGGDGYRAVCSCGWRSLTSWDRAGVARSRNDHKRRSRLQEIR